MTKALLVLLTVLVAAVWVGCEDYDDQPLEFTNASSFTVVVTSLSIEWTGFALAPGQKVKMKHIRDVDFAWEPDKYVKLGFASTDRYVVFVDIERDEIEW